MVKLRPSPILTNGQYPIHVPRNLQSATHAFVRHDAHHTPLQWPYDGPFRVLHRSDKFFRWILAHIQTMSPLIISNQTLWLYRLYQPHWNHNHLWLLHQSHLGITSLWLHFLLCPPLHPLGYLFLAIQPKLVGLFILQLTSVLLWRITGGEHCSNQNIPHYLDILLWQYQTLYFN